LAKFKEVARWEKVDSKAFLNLDCLTRWNSTYEMLKAACTYEKVFLRYPEEDPYMQIELLSEVKPGVPGPGVPNEHDWENARKLAEFLGHFAAITTRVSASLSVSAHTLFHEIGEINELVKEWMNSSDFVQQEMGRRMKEKYDKYWGSGMKIQKCKMTREKERRRRRKILTYSYLLLLYLILDTSFPNIQNWQLMRCVVKVLDRRFGLQLPNACKNFLKITGSEVCHLKSSPNKVNHPNLRKVERMVLVVGSSRPG
jgi:hypothetical protein